jgi:hypothetical protein
MKSKTVTVTVTVIRTTGDRVAAYGRVTSAEHSAGGTESRPVWYEAANRAAAKALRGRGTIVGRGVFAFARLTAPELIDLAYGGRGNYSATAADSRGAVMGRALIAVG